MNYQEHRLYKRLNEPFRILGLTVDELALGLLGFIFFMNVKILFLKFVFLILGGGGACALKRVKKQMKSFNMRSTLVWHGFLKPPSSKYPSPFKRFYLP